MKKMFLKKIVVLAAAATMVLGMGGICASAISYKGTTYATTSGGIGGKVEIRSRVYKDYYNPYSSVNVYYYGVVSDIHIDSELITTFKVTGTLSNATSSTPISKSGTANSVKAYATSSYSNMYNHCNSKTTTSSSAFGTSTQECNYSF